MLDTRRLILLRDLSAYGTVTLVAEAPGLTVSAVSQRLRALEAEAGTPLTLRAERGMRLARAGEVLGRRTTKVIAAWRRRPVPSSPWTAGSRVHWSSRVPRRASPPSRGRRARSTGSAPTGSAGTCSPAA
ncbi:LysR family transcriptional regulator [Streptomyces sp. NPDC001508]|uniref:LysR family transcriptional regulator n=1 Tax=Streptomyces sp. NPDC001508 TaxID=3154656 RepID=UPI00332DE185